MGFAWNESFQRSDRYRDLVARQFFHYRVWEYLVVKIFLLVLSMALLGITGVTGCGGGEAKTNVAASMTEDQLQEREAMLKKAEDETNNSK